jgi:1-phosphatidylinositol-4-phosphate 5-kinase
VFKEGITLSDGSSYTGEVNEAGHPHGDGKLTTQKGRVDEGEFKDGFLDGFGTVKDRDGTYYKGQLMAGKLHGEGVLTQPNGIVIESNFFKGVQ